LFVLLVHLLAVRLAVIEVEILARLSEFVFWRVEFKFATGLLLGFKVLEKFLETFLDGVALTCWASFLC
jgi:hypothetical protein